MSVQVFLQGKLLGIEDFLLSSGQEPTSLVGRSRWVSLLSEVLPRAILTELGLSPLLLGSSGGGQFILVLPAEFVARAEKILDAARIQAHAMSGGTLKLVWASTENLGEWPIVRRRLNAQMTARRGAPLRGLGARDLVPFDSEPETADDSYFVTYLVHALDTAERVSWSASEPAKILPGELGEHQWPLEGAGIPVSRHRADFAPGTRLGVLVGDVDNFATRLRRLETIEDFIQTSLMYKQFVAGELQLALMALPNLADRVTVLYSGGDDFAVYGAWDSLILLAREIHRVFRLHAETNLKDLPGNEAKTVTMALAVAPEADAPLVDVYAAARHNLDVAKTGARDSFFLFGRSLEWKLLDDAEELKKMMLRLVRDFDCSPQFLNELRTFYREGTGSATRRRAVRFDQPWRFYRRLARTLEPTVKSRRQEREFEKLTSTVMKEFIGKQAGQTRLRPSGRVALEWAQMNLQD